MKNRLIDLVHSLKGAHDEISVWEITLRYFCELQFDVINYGVVNKSDKSLIGLFSNMKAEWMKHYLDSKYNVSDPFIDYAYSEQKDILCLKETRDNLLSPDSENAKLMFHDLSDEGLKSSIFSPYHPSNKNVIVGVALWSGMKSREFTKFAHENKSEILIGSGLVQSHLQWMSPDLTDYSQWYPLQRNILTAREREVLKWLSAGLRNDRIADKMNIANVTVNFHVASIKRKLDAKTREHAIAIAVSQCLIEI